MICDARVRFCGLYNDVMGRIVVKADDIKQACQKMEEQLKSDEYSLTRMLRYQF